MIYEVLSVMITLKRRFSVELCRILELRRQTLHPVIQDELLSSFSQQQFPIPFPSNSDSTSSSSSSSSSSSGVRSAHRVVRIHKVWGSSPIRSFFSSRDDERNMEGAVGAVQSASAPELHQEIQSSLSHRRRAGWPWISVIPSEASGYMERREPMQEQHSLDSSQPQQQNPKIDSTESYRHPGTKRPLDILPLNVPDQVCSLLSRYGWSAHTLMELRRLMGEIKFLKPRQVQVVLNRQRHADVALGFLQWAMAEGNCKLHIKSFTVVMPLLGRVRRFDLLEKLLHDLEEKGYVLDKILCTAAMRSYAEGHKMQEALELFSKMKERGFQPDCVTYSVLIQMYSKTRLYQEAIKLYEEMLASGIATDTQLYNCVICTFGKAGRLDLAYKKLAEMRERGHVPDQFTYGVLIEGYAKAGRLEFLDIYQEMKSAGIPLNEVIFNILFLGIGRIGTLKHAESVFADMEQVGLSANLNAFATLISMCSKTGNAQDAQRWFDEMVRLRLQPTQAMANSLLDAYARSRRFGEAKKTLDSFHTLGVTPNLQTFTVCLRCLSLSEQKEEVKVVQKMLSCHEGSQFLSLLLDSSVDEMNLAPRVSSFFSTLHLEKRQFRREFVDALINYLYKIGYRRQANQVWEEALASYVFLQLVEQGPEGICTVNLQGMEFGTAIVALTRTLPRLIKQFRRKEMTPQWVQIVTGPVRELPKSDTTSVHQAVAVLLQTLNSPFQADTLQTVSGFVSRGEDVIHWLDEPQVKAMLAFKH